MSGSVPAKLTLDDIADLRAYERQRDDFRARIIALKKTRRVAVGPVVTLVFENRDTIRFQVQEMARAERMSSDEQVQAELDIYNPLIPTPGQLSATLFIELTSKSQLEEWLPRLVGIEKFVEISLRGEGTEEVVRCAPDPDHASRLTREDVTASVHYLRFFLRPDQVERFAAGPVPVRIAHPAYGREAELGEVTRASLLADLRGSSA